MGTATNAAHDTTNDAAQTVTRTGSSDDDPQPPSTAPSGSSAGLASAPSHVGRYEIRGVLGTGAMGVVYRARDPQLDRALAIKLVRTDGASRSRGARLLREAQAMARLRHPNVVPIFDVGLADDAVFVAMPLLEGGTLHGWLRDAPRSLDQILDRFVAAGRGLAAAHDAGLVHRDFKPDNVLLGEAGEVQVADFGLARLAHGSPARGDAPRPFDPASQIGHVAGTPAYMSPEQLRGRPSDARADQFSFCVAMWESIYDERPFGKPSTTADPLQARLEAIDAGPVVSRRDRPAWIAQVLARGLASDPEDRWPSMKALLDAIAAHRAPRRWPVRLAVAVGALAAAGSIAALAWPGGRSQPAPYHLEPLTHRSDIRQAALSPDGTRLAFVEGDALVVRSAEPDAEDRVIVDHGIADSPLSWSPDGTRLVVGLPAGSETWVTAQLIDVASGDRITLPGRGRGAFLSTGEIAVSLFRQRSIEIYPAAPRAPSATCEVPGDYTFLWNVVGLRDGTMAVETVKGDVHGLVLLRRDCRVRATFSGEPFSSVAASDTGTLVALIPGEGFGEILELSPDGVVLSRRRVNGDIDEVLGRRRGVDYVATLTLQTHLDRAHPGWAPVRQLSVNGRASFSLAPDGTTMAWIESGNRGRGRLRLSTLDNLSRRSTPLLDNALLAGWSPDGRSLAVLVDQGGDAEVVVLDRAGATVRHLPLQQLDRAAAPVWLDDHRIAAQTQDRTTYRWFDLETGEHDDLVDRRHGSTYWLVRSPRDGMLAMWRNGLPDAGDPTERVWVKPPGGPARPLPIRDAAQHWLLPSWTPSGELIVRALETGEVSRVALDTGELTPVAQLPVMPVRSSFDEHVMTLPGGDLLAVEIELGIAVSAVLGDDASRARPRREPDPSQL